MGTVSNVLGVGETLNSCSSRELKFEVDSTICVVADFCDCCQTFEKDNRGFEDRGKIGCREGYAVSLEGIGGKLGVRSIWSKVFVERCGEGALCAGIVTASHAASVMKGKVGVEGRVVAGTSAITKAETLGLTC
jgi:hypothetical protein